MELGDRKQGSGVQTPIAGCVESFWSHHAPVEEYRQLGLKGDQRSLLSSKDLGSKQSSISSSVLLASKLQPG